jgi:lipopolysaccharide transport protein LptA
MRIFCIITLLALADGPALRAQTNSAPRPATRIDSDTVNFDMNVRQAVYAGHVQVADPQMKLTCAQLVVGLPEPGQHISHIVAETNVMVDFNDGKGQTMHATGDRAIYAYSLQGGVTNETVTLTGHAQVESAQGTLTGEPIVWDRANNRMTAANQQMTFRQSLDSIAARTNAPAAKTNFPPGTIQNIDKIIAPVNSQTTTQ